MDLTETIAPKSDQLDAVDLQVSGPRTFTVESVSKGNREQPVNIRLAGLDRVWRPSKSMRRVLVSGWGPDGSKYAGKRLTLFCDEKVKYAGEEVGGIRISHMSDLVSSPLKTVLIMSRGKSAVYTVQRLDDAPAAPRVNVTADMIAACTDEATLRQWWGSASPDLQPVIVARVEALRAGGESDAS